MNLLQVTILSIVEGLTEFLPVSSTGHLILTSKILNITQTDFVKSFEIYIQLGAIMAVTYIYFSLLWKKKSILLKITAAFLPSAFIGLLFYRYIKEILLGNSYITVISLFWGGIILIVIEKISKNKTAKILALENISLEKAIVIGIFQSISVIPGVSRAAATIIGGTLLGLSRKTAAEFSFILAIPTMLAATMLDLYKEGFQFNREEITLLVTGVLLSFIFALMAVKFLIRFTENNSFTLFGIYRVAIALLFFFIFLL